LVLGGRKKQRTGKGYSNPPFVAISRRALFSEEWANLTPKEKIFYIQLKARYNGSNNGQITFPYKKAQHIKGLQSARTISSAAQGLEDKEWIERSMEGGLHRYTTKYRLTFKYDDFV
jgi:hypothetical protein